MWAFFNFPNFETRMKLGRLVFFISVLLFGAAVTPARAETFRLFDCSGFPKPVAMYPALILAIGAGDEIVFCDRTIKVKSRLGAGQTSVIFQVEGEVPGAPDRALRMYKNNRVHNSVMEIYAGAQELERAGIPHTKIVGWQANQYVLSELLSPRHFTLADYINGKVKIPYDEKVFLNQLEVFAGKTWTFQQIGDMKTENIVFDVEKGQVLLADWANGNGSADSFLSHHRFDSKVHRADGPNAFTKSFASHRANHLPNDSTAKALAEAKLQELEKLLYPRIASHRRLLSDYLCSTDEIVRSAIAY